jgi:hypothetical protein
MPQAQFTEQEIERVMAERNLDKKGARQFLTRQAKKAAAAANTTPETPNPATTEKPAPVANTATIDTHDQHAIDNFHNEGGPAPVEVDETPAAPGTITTTASAPVTTSAPVQPPVTETATSGKPGRKSKLPGFDAALAVKLYLEGKKVIDIAVACGYPKGQGNNRVRQALEKAGVYKKVNTGLPDVSAPPVANTGETVADGAPQQ